MLSITDLQFVSFRISSHETEYLNGIIVESGYFASPASRLWL
jgi:hypothetical protein